MKEARRDESNRWSSHLGRGRFLKVVTISNFAGLIVVLGLFQLAQVLIEFELVGQFGLSYWTIDYSEGFVRRGLTGYLADLLPGSDRTGLQLQVLIWLISISAGAAFLLTILHSWKRGNQSAPLLLVIAVASPLGVEFLLAYRRSDQLGFLVFLGFMFVLATARFESHRIIVCLFAGIALAGASLVHEAVVLLFLPWMIIGWLADRRRKKPERQSSSIWQLAGLTLAPSAMLIFISTKGLPDQDHVERLWQQAQSRGWIPTRGMYNFLGDTQSESFQRVLDLGTSKFLGFALLIGVMFASHFAIMRMGRQSSGPTVDLPESAMTRSMLVYCLPIATYAVLFAIAVDWTRWAAWFFVCWTVFQTIANQPDFENNDLRLAGIFSEPVARKLLKPGMTVPLLCYLCFLHADEMGYPVRETVRYLFGY